MPLISSQYRAPVIFRNAHLSTIYASKLRKVDFKGSFRQRLELEDGDFIDLDRSFAKTKNSRLVILLHGLAGNASRPYMLAMSRIFHENGWDTSRMNFRNCSGESNRLYRSYHAGATGDLEIVIREMLKENYTEIVLAGFSLGGNLMLKYLGESNWVAPQIKAAVAISVPCDLGASLEELNRSRNFIYSKRFLGNLRKDLFQKQKDFPQEISAEEIKACTSLLAIDELYTSRAHGFKNARDYYDKNSSLQFLPEIEIPTLLINARNDSFLSASSYPEEIAAASKQLYLEIPPHGGHVGFIQKKRNYYHEERALQFIETHTGAGQ